ncbi:hypothetical protein [Ensifer adhaerens]|uniref:hypothetical protein n=1 Tax=Ensifer adhaerens TaxID=106592 RepID=UPI0007621918|nr:hypothetical protein [Ensifer adhaerens]MBW0365214.1 hypothetical protein [Ensifer adhaerens]UCM24058.1 hypothetical protein LDL63_30345 [Ensifer adhaerens]
MKIIIATAASLAIAGSALAAVPSTTAEQKPSLKTVRQVDLAWGPNRSGSKAPSTGKYSNGKTFG